MFKELFTETTLNESKYTWDGGPDDYEDARKIEKLLDGFDFYSHMINDYKKQQKKEQQNKVIKAELKNIGVKSFQLKGDKTVRKV